MEDTESGFWSDVREYKKSYKKEHFDERMRFAEKIFIDNGVKYVLCNADNGHFNLLGNKGKVVMSFWSWTGKVYIPNKNISKNVGIYKCIDMYKRVLAEVKNG